WAVAFDAEGRTLASGGDDSTVKLWEPTSGQLLCTLDVGKEVLSVAFDPVGHTLAAAGEGETIDLWDPDSGQLKRSLEGHTDAVNWVGFSPVHRLLATKGLDDTVRVWDADGGACVVVIAEPAANWVFPSLAFHPHLPLLATVGSDPGTQRGN